MFVYECMHVNVGCDFLFTDIGNIHVNVYIRVFTNEL